MNINNSASFPVKSEEPSPFLRKPKGQNAFDLCLPLNLELLSEQQTAVNAVKSSSWPAKKIKNLSNFFFTEKEKKEGQERRDFQDQRFEERAKSSPRSPSDSLIRQNSDKKMTKTISFQGAFENSLDSINYFNWPVAEKKSQIKLANHEFKECFFEKKLGQYSFFSSEIVDLSVKCFITKSIQQCYQNQRRLSSESLFHSEAYFDEAAYNLLRSKKIQKDLYEKIFLNFSNLKNNLIESLMSQKCRYQTAFMRQCIAFVQEIEENHTNYADRYQVKLTNMLVIIERYIQDKEIKKIILNCFSQDKKEAIFTIYRVNYWLSEKSWESYRRLLIKKIREPLVQNQVLKIRDITKEVELLRKKLESEQMVRSYFMGCRIYDVLTVNGLDVNIESKCQEEFIEAFFKILCDQGVKYSEDLFKILDVGTISMWSLCDKMIRMIWAPLFSQSYKGVLSQGTECRITVHEKRKYQIEVIKEYVIYPYLSEDSFVIDREKPLFSFQLKAAFKHVDQNGQSHWSLDLSLVSLKKLTVNKKLWSEFLDILFIQKEYIPSDCEVITTVADMKSC